MKTLCILLFHLLALVSCASHHDTSLHSASPGTQQREGDIVLDLRTNKPRYLLGEPIAVTLTTSQPCSVTIWSEDAKGQRTPVWPMPFASQAIVVPGRPLHLPPQNADWQFAAAKPTGINTLVAQARPLPVPHDHLAVPPAKPYAAGKKGIAIAPLTSLPPGGPIGKSSEARWLYEVE